MMAWRRRLLAGGRWAAALLLLFLVSSAVVVQCSSSSSSDSQQMRTYLVHVKENLVNASARRSWHLALLSNATGLPPSSPQLLQRLIYSYSIAFHGFAALLSPSEASGLGALEDVVALSEASVSELHTTRTPSFLGLSNSVDINHNASSDSDDGPLWAASSRGKNVIIGVIDTGVWPEHPSFSDAGHSPLPAGAWNASCHPSFPCNNKIIGAQAFSAGYVADTGRPINESLEFDSPRDSDGHGTHTAATVAGAPIPSASFFDLASGAASGIAPFARLSIYKACWLKGCYDVDIIAAFEAAISDGVHVISVSLGGHGNTIYATDGIAIGSFAAVAKGITVVCSAGNDGPAIGSVSNGSPWILTVAASSLDRDFPAPVTLGNGDVYVGSSLYVGPGLSKNDPALKPLIRAKDAAIAGVEADKASLCIASSYLDRELVEGKIVLCEDGNVNAVTKALAVAGAGGAGTIVASLPEFGEELVSAAYLNPGALVGNREAEAIQQYIDDAESPTARIDFNGTRLTIGGRAPAMAAFSSRGPQLMTMELAKPDITAPGLNILAAWPDVSSPSGDAHDRRRNVSFNIISGTSMSCPHVAGLAALLKAAHPTWSPAAIRSAIMTTATTADSTNQTIVDLATLEPGNPLSFGSGHVRPNLALDPGLVYDIQPQDYVDFLCALDPSGSLTLEYGSASTSCSDPLPTISNLNYPSFSVVFYQSSYNSSTLSSTFHRTVTNVGHPNSLYIVSVTPPLNVNVSVFPTALSFDTQTQRRTYSITFSAPRSFSSDIRVAFGSLSWFDTHNHVVQSPISVFWMP